MDTHFNLVNETNSEEDGSVGRSKPVNSHFTRTTSISQPSLNVNNNAFGLDMLVNKTMMGDTKSVNSDKTNIFQSSEEGEGEGEEDECEDEDEVNDEDDERSHYEPRKKSPNSFNTSSNYFRHSVPERSETDINNEKSEILYQFSRMEKKGFKLPKTFCMDSDLNEMKAELERMKKDKEVDASVAFQRNLLLTFTSGVEMLNSTIDPFGIKLNGWSESIHESADDYEDVFEELHYKYKSKAHMAPELKLLMMMGGSAFQFHIMNTMFKSAAPEVGEVFKQNPDLMKQFAGATAKTMANNNSDKEQSGMLGMLSGMFGGNNNNNNGMFGGNNNNNNGMFGGNNNNNGMFGGNNGMFSGGPPIPQNSNTTNTMKGPANLDSLLSNLDISDDNRLETMSTATPSEMSEMTETNSIRNLLSSKKKGKKTTHSLNI